MRQLGVLIASFGMLCIFVAQASATNLSEEQVKDTCGGKLQSASYSDGTKASGCDRRWAAT